MFDGDDPGLIPWSSATEASCKHCKLACREPQHTLSVSAVRDRRKVSPDTSCHDEHAALELDHPCSYCRSLNN